jgi:hypothetical protein
VKRFTLFLLVVFLAACGGGGGEPATIATEPTAIPATAAPPTDAPLTAEPTAEPTATAVPELDLATAIGSIPLPGHLSATVSSDEELLFYWRGSEDVALGDDFYNLSFHNDDTGNHGGEVVVYLYDSPETAAANFTLIRAHFDTLIAPGDYDFVGDAGASASSDPFRHRAFTLCDALVYIRMSGATSDQIDAYAQGVAAAIETAVCDP